MGFFHCFFGSLKSAGLQLQRRIQGMLEVFLELALAEAIVYAAAKKLPV